jgi:hypothetical protein
VPSIAAFAFGSADISTVVSSVNNSPRCGTSSTATTAITMNTIAAAASVVVGTAD